MKSGQNVLMNTIEQFGISPEVMANLEAAAERVASGARDPERVRAARESMDRIREEIYRRHGLLDIGGPAIRELRDA